MRKRRNIPIYLGILNISATRVGIEPNKGRSVRTNIAIASLHPVDCDTIRGRL